MNAAIDYGNSAAKVGIFNDRHLVEKITFSSSNELRSFLTKSDTGHVIVSSVNEDPQLVSSWAAHASKKLVLNPELPVPIKNLYSTPKTLGVDRLAAVCGSREFFPGTNCLVIDAGTCITYDFIDSTNSYHGGGISPGLSMRLEALHTFTAKLPLVSPKQNVDLIGNSTEKSIQSGVINGMVAEIDGIIEKYQGKFDNLKVILCGGDARFFENQLKASIFASPDLVLFGLNSILLYNVTTQ